tara:strand:- start:9311 stop:9541 length:231 start_codon:yes stop_codon:yes gene_type:complete
MSYNRSFMITKKVTSIIEADVAKVSEKTLNIDTDFRAHKVIEGLVTKYLLDFGTNAPQIELVVDGNSIDAKFVVTD